MVKYVAALDIGTTGLRMLVGKVTDSGSTHIIAKTAVPCRGVRKYQIEDPKELVSAIKKVLRKIEEQTDIIVKSAYVSIQGAYVGYVRNTATIEIEDGVVSNSSIADLLDKTSDIELYEDEVLVDVIPVKYVINETETVLDPLGIEAQTLRVEADIVTANADAVERITSYINDAGLEVDGFVPSAAAMMGLIPDYDEGENSTLLIDVGGSNTEFAVYSQNYPFFASSVPVGGDHITNDVATIFNISAEEAETIKRDYAIAAAELVSNNVDVAVFNVEKGMQELIKIKDIVEVMEARVVALLNFIADKLEKEGINPAGINRVVFCGDGLNSFNGMDILCDEIFESKYVKVDFSRATGMKGCYTYASGMVMYMSKLLPLGRVDSKIEKKSFGAEMQKESSASTFGNTMNDVKNKVKGWFARFKE